MSEEFSALGKRFIRGDRVPRKQLPSPMQAPSSPTHHFFKEASMAATDAPALGSTDAIDIDKCIVKLWDAELVSGTPGFRLGRQLTATYVLIVLIGGEGTLAREGKKSRMRPDTVYVCPPDTTFGMVADHGDEFAVVLLRISLFQESSHSRHVQQEVILQEWLTAGAEIAVGPSGKLSDWCRAIIEQGASADPLQRWRAQLGVQELLYETMAAARQQPQASTGSPLERAKAYMEEQYHKDVTIQHLAEIAELSPKYFVDLFKKTYGVSALDHLTEVRMANAKRLMLRSERKLKDIAHEVGYDDEFYFSRKFKKEHGISPTQFMRRRQRRIAAYGSVSVLGYLLPLQLIPYAAPLHPKWAGYYYDRYGADIPYHLDAYRNNQHKQANLERLAEAKPDLIVCPPDLEPWEKERLAAITQVLELPSAGDAGWKTALRALAGQLGEESEAERWIAAYEHQCVSVRERMSGSQKEEIVVPVRLLKNRLFAYCNQGISDVIYGDLGVQRPPGEPASGLFNHPLTLEQLGAYGPVRILLFICRETETLEGWKRLRQTPEWLSLPVVQEDKLTIVDSDPWREYSPVALERILDEAGRLFSGNRP